MAPVEDSRRPSSHAPPAFGPAAASSGPQLDETTAPLARDDDPLATHVSASSPWGPPVPEDSDDPLATRASASSPWAPPVPEDSDDPLATRASTSPPWDPHVPEDSPGDPPRIGRFIVLREIGRGAMGVVYAAYDDELDRRVALKLVHAGHHDDPSIGRNQLLREAQALARLTHPNVVAVHEAGVFRGSVFIAMEYVDGVDLQRWLARKPRSWREVVAVLRQAGEGLRAAHAAGLIHRDFKPSNVLVGEDGRVCVADFGLATRRGRSGTSAHVPGSLEGSTAPALATLAGSGALIGTPAYMAPEQLRREPATAASDQFAFCVTLWEALYGQRPFTGDDLDALAREVLHGAAPQPPPGAAVPAWLPPLLLRGLSREPARRFPDMGALLEHLARDPEAERQRRRRLVLQFAAAVAATVLVVLAGVYAYRAAVRDAHERRAAARLDVLRDQLAELTASGKRDEAARLFAAFVALPDNRGTAALARAFREWGDAQTDPAAAVDAHAGAYIAARTREDQVTALRSLALRLADLGAFAETDAALAALDARAPELADDPALVRLRVATALDRRDLPTALAALERLPASDPKRSYGHVLRHLSRGSSISRAALGHRNEGQPVFVAGDLDDDGRRELVTIADTRDAVLVLRTDPALTPLTEIPTAKLVSPELTGGSAPKLVGTPRPIGPALAGVPLFLLGLDNPAGDGATFVRYGLQPLDGGPPLHVWEDSHLLAYALGDLDGDGQAEIYTGSGPYARKLSQIKRDAAGQWSRAPAHPSTNAATSDIHAIQVVDLDGDGRRELAVAVGPWGAYDLRVLRADDTGRLRLIARRTIGSIYSLVHLRSGGGEVRLALSKRDMYENPTRFSAAAPFGEPAGIYVFALVGDRLEQRQFFPAPAADSGRPPPGHLFAADFDGDGVDDLLDDAGGRLSLYRGDGDALLDPLELPGLHALVVGQFDDDPEAEVLTRVAGDLDGYLLLGAGDVPLPVVPRPAPTARPIPADIPDPAIAEAWQHAEELAALGLPRRSAAELAAIARLSDHAQEDMFFRAAELHEAAGEHAAAAEHYLAAAARADLADQALAGAIRSHRALGEFAAAEELALTRAALPRLSPRVRAEAEAELTALRRATADRPTLALRFDRPLDPRWRIVDPLAFARAPGTDSLSLQTSTDKIVAEYPLEWDGGTAALGVDLALDELEWGTNLTIAVTPVDGDDIWLGVRVEASGLSERPHQQIAVITGAGGSLPLRWVTPGPGQRVRLVLRHYPDLDAAQIEVTRDGGEPERRPARSRVQAPAPGPLRLRVLSTSIQPDAVAGVQVFGVDLVGLRPGPALPGDDDGWRPVARLIAEEEVDAALQRLAHAPHSSPQALWRIDLLARAGRLDEAADALRAALAGLADDHPFVARLRQRLVRDPDNLTLAAKRALGPALYEFFVDLGRREYAWRPARVRFHLTDLAAHPLTPPPPSAGADARRHHRNGLLLRALAWYRAGRDDLAARDLEALIDLLPPDANDQLRKYVLRRLIDASVRLRDAARARRWITAALTESASTELMLESIRDRPGIHGLFTPEDWNRFDALVSR